MPGRRNPRIRTLLLEASGPQEAEEQYAKRKRLSNTKAPRDPLGPLPQLPSRPAPHLKGSHVDQPPPNPIKFIRFGGGLPVEGGRPSIRRDRTQCTRGPRGTRRCPRVYPGTLGVYPRTLGFTRGRSGIHGDARVYPGTLCVRGYARGRSGLPADARVYPGPLRRPGDARGIPGDARVHPGTLGFTRGPRGISGDPWVYPGTPDVRYARAKSSLPGPGEGRFRPSWARFGGSPGGGGQEGPPIREAYPMFRQCASGPEIGLPGRISTRF